MTANSQSIQTIVGALRAGSPVRAESLCREALAQTPDDADVLFSLAMSLHMQGRLDEAIPIYLRLTELQPSSFTHWSNYATALANSGRVEAAETAIRRAIGLNPHDANAHLQLGLLLIARRDYAAARDSLLDAFERDRNAPAIRVHAANACTLCHDFQGAEELLRGWRQWLPLHDDALQMDLARLLLLLADAPGSQEVLADLVRRQPGNAEPTIQLARIEERLNLLDEARARLASLNREALTAAQRGEFDFARATLMERDGAHAAARALLEATGPQNDTDYAYYFTLARCCDKLSDSAAAMDALSKAHARQTTQMQAVTPANYEAKASALPATVVRTDKLQYRRWPAQSSPTTRESPIFVVGFPRSGTTLLEQMLDAHPRLQSMDENPFFDRLAGKLRAHDPRILDDLSVLRQYDCDELRKRYLVMAADKVAIRANAQLVDKNPLNLLWLPLIHRLFPHAKYILCLRHPCDVLLSCYMQNFRSGLLAAACENLPRLAKAYVQAMRCWIDHVEVFQPDVLESRYEDLVAAFEPQTRRIAEFLGLEDPAPLLQFDRHARAKSYIATPSYSQVIEPVNTKGLGRWQGYRNYLEPALPILKPILDHWDYPTDPA